MRKTSLALLAGLSLLVACAAPSAPAQEKPPAEPPPVAQVPQIPAPAPSEPAPSEPAPSEPAPNEPKPAPGAAPDYSCKQASDCAIKNVGNCCGYYPRCVNAQSVFEPMKCKDGMMGVCGYPSITHCACVLNKCVSMQGDKEI